MDWVYRRMYINDTEQNSWLDELSDLAQKAFVMLISMVFLGIGVFLLVKDGNEKKECTVPVTAEVVDIVTNTTGAINKSITAAPVYQYEYAGSTYQVQSSLYQNPIPLYRGDVVDIFIDPNDYEHIYSPAETKNKPIEIIFIVLGGFATLFFAFLSGKSFINFIRCLSRK